MALTGAQVTMVERCSAIDGTWGLRAENVEMARKIAKPLMETIEEAETDLVAGDCHLANTAIARGDLQGPGAPDPGLGPRVRPRGRLTVVMQKLTTADIKDLREYERERDEFRAEVIAMKKRRRFALGPLMSIVFENATTMRFQIQEMARAERMLTDEQIATELATYNELIPDAEQLSATLFIEIEDDAELRRWLPLLVGIQDHVAIEVGGDTVRAIPTTPIG